MWRVAVSFLCGALHRFLVNYSQGMTLIPRGVAACGVKSDRKDPSPDEVRARPNVRNYLPLLTLLERASFCRDGRRVEVNRFT